MAIVTASGNYLLRMPGGLPQGNHTVMAWVFPTVLNSWHGVFSSGLGYQYYLWIGARTAVPTGWEFYGYDNTRALVEDPLPVVNNWFHICGRGDSSAGTNNFELDVFRLSNEAIGNDVYGCTTDFRDDKAVIGCAAFASPEEYWLGRIAAMKIWTVQLSDQELLLERFCIRPQTNLNSLWYFSPLWDPAARIDHSGQGNDFTEVGTVGTADGPPIPWGLGLPLIVSVPAVVEYTLIADPGTFVETGAAVGLKADRKIVAASTNFVETGSPANLEYGRKVAAQSGTFLETGAVALLTATRKLGIESGSFAETGMAASLEYGRKLAIESGSFTIAGMIAALIAARLITIEGGSFVETGQDVNLIYTPISDYILVAGSGAFTETGMAVALRTARKIVMEAGSFTETGAAVNLEYGRKLAIGIGEFIETGMAVGLKADRKLLIEPANFILTGMIAALIYDTGIVVEQILGDSKITLKLIDDSEITLRLVGNSEITSILKGDSKLS